VSTNQNRTADHQKGEKKGKRKMALRELYPLSYAGGEKKRRGGGKKITMAEGGRGARGKGKKKKGGGTSFRHTTSWKGKKGRRAIPIQPRREKKPDPAPLTFRREGRRDGGGRKPRTKRKKKKRGRKSRTFSFLCGKRRREAPDNKRQTEFRLFLHASSLFRREKETRRDQSWIRQGRNGETPRKKGKEKRKPVFFRRLIEIRGKKKGGGGGGKKEEGSFPRKIVGRKKEKKRTNSSFLTLSGARKEEEKKKKGIQAPG